MRSLSRGLVASALGTLAMDTLWFSRSRRGGRGGGFPAWECSSEIARWREPPAPARAAKRIVEGVFGRSIPVERAGLVNNVTHWGFGLANGVQYAVLERFRREPRIRDGLPFALGV